MKGLFEKLKTKIEKNHFVITNAWFGLSQPQLWARDQG